LFFPAASVQKSESADASICVAFSEETFCSSSLTAPPLPSAIALNSAVVNYSSSGVDEVTSFIDVQPMKNAAKPQAASCTLDIKCAPIVVLP
jgi:hypothetical protein